MFYKDKKQTDFLETENELVEIKPLRDFKITFNEFNYDLKEGVKCDVHKMFLQNLKTEKVIRE